MVLQILIEFIILAAIIFFVVGVVVPLFKKEKQPVITIEDLVDESEKVAIASKEVKSKVKKTEEKISQVKNNLKNN